MSLIGNVDTPESYVADYMQACVGMFGIPAGGFTSDIETFGSATSYDVESLYAAMLNSTIGRSIYAPGISNESFATKLVDKVGGGLLSDANKAAAIDEVQALLDGGLSRAATAMAVVEFVAGLETSDETFGTVAQQFQNRIEIANYYTFSSTSPSSTLSTLTAVLSGVSNTTDVSDPEGYLGSVTDPGVSTGQTYTLTTGVDNIVGTSGNDTISGVVSATAGESTMTLADVINGGAGTDTFKLTSSGATQMSTSEIKNVENFEIKDLTGGRTHSFANVTGEAQVLIVASTGNTTVTNLDKAVVGIKDITGAATTQEFQFKDTAFANTATVEVSLENAGNKTTAARQTIKLDVATTDGVANAMSIAATGSNYVTFAQGSNADVSTTTGLKTLTVTGSGSLDIDAASTVASDGSTLAANLTTVNLSGNSGGVTMQVDKTTVVVTGGSGADKISVGGAMTKGATFNLGAGNDQLLKAGGSIDANVVVDAGDGTDTISNGLITVANGGIFKNFEKIALDTATTTDVELLTGSTISSLLVSGNVAATVQNVASGATIDVTSTTGASDVTVGVKGATAATTDSLTVNFDGAAQASTPSSTNIKFGNLVADKVETINIVSGGADNTWNSITVKGDTALKTMTITGAKNLDLAFSGTNGTNTSGKGAVSLIDGSAATGKLAINLANVTYDGDTAGFTLKGGTGADTITTNASSATLIGGGGNDKYVVTATVGGTADATTAAMTTITDFNAGDMIAAGTISGLFKTQTDIAAATNLTQAIDLALKNASVTAANAAWFNYGGNTYVVVEDANDGFGATTQNELIVKLTGTLDLTNATVASNTITMV